MTRSQKIRGGTAGPRRASARALGVLALVVCVSMLPDSVSGQRPLETPNEGPLTGVVMDAISDRPIADVLVVLDDDRRAVLTDSLGRFDFGTLASGEVELTVRRYGYQTQGVIAFLPPGDGLDVEIPLPPLAVLVDGLSVVTERLETMEQRLTSRRRATPLPVMAVGQDRLVRTSARDVLEMLHREATLHIRPCGRRSFGSACVQRRGRLVEPRVFVDEMPVIGGLDQLSLYQPYDLYLVEVYGRGLEIRAYTHQFMDRMARKPITLVPVRIW